MITKKIIQDDILADISKKYTHLIEEIQNSISNKKYRIIKNKKLGIEIVIKQCNNILCRDELTFYNINEVCPMVVEHIKTIDKELSLFLDCLCKIKSNYKETDAYVFRIRIYPTK